VIIIIIIIIGKFELGESCELQRAEYFEAIERNILRFRRDLYTQWL
jgi:hypothetical protein